jgi:hypothetical protein
LGKLRVTGPRDRVSGFIRFKEGRKGFVGR